MLFRLFLFILLLSPIPFGANRPWAWHLYTVLIALTALSVCLAIVFKRSSLAISLQEVKYPLILTLIPIIWSAFQLSDWAPEAWTHPFWQITAKHLSEPIPGHISLAPEETGSAITRLTSYLLVFLISLQFNRQREYAELTFKGIATAGFIYAVYGLIVFLGDFKTVLWFEKWTYSTDVTATFVNRNSYATYAGLSLLASFPLLFDKIQFSLSRGLSTYTGKQYFLENLLSRAWLPLLMAITLSTALLLTHSRGGFLSTLLAIAAFFVVLALSRKIRSGKRLFGLLLIFAVAYSIFQYSGEKLVERLDQLDDEGRLDIYNILMKASAENLWLGVGYGSFENGFKLYQDETFPLHTDKAHNTYLENIFELGLLPALSLFLGILWIGLKCLAGVWRRHKDWIYPAIGFSATLLVGAHAFVDFSLQIPAVTYTYALIMGASLAQARSGRRQAQTQRKRSEAPSNTAQVNFPDA